MSKALIVRPEAETEISEAYKWYEHQCPGLGGDFLDMLDAAFRKIRNAPQSYPLALGDVRKTLLRRFPYQVLFIEGKQHTVVLAVFHAKRDPSQWRKRT